MESYARGRKCYDADSHIMETADWLAGHADPSVRDDLPSFVPQGGKASAAGRMLLGSIEEAEKRRADPEATRQLEQNVIAGTKGWLAHGATDPTERRRTLDLLGFEKQLVFATFSMGQFAFSRDPHACPLATLAVLTLARATGRDQHSLGAVPEGALDQQRVQPASARNGQHAVSRELGAAPRVRIDIEARAR